MNAPTSSAGTEHQPAHAGSGAHAPGPWNLKGDEIYGRHEGTPYGCIAKVWDSGNIPESAREANGRLLAAAPALLAVVEQFVKWFETVGSDKCPYDEAKAALALARP